MNRITNTFITKANMGRWTFSLLLYVLPASLVFPFSSQPPVGYTGAPPQSRTCAQCHTSQGSGSLSFKLGDGGMNYIPGQTYDLEVLLRDTGQERFGFSMTSRVQDQPTTPTGTWTAGSDSVVYDGGQHIGHRNAPFDDGRHTFRMTWTAPSEDVGNIVFYAVGNAANGNFSNGAGDNVYARQFVISPAMMIESFWANSPIEEGWRFTGEGYPDLIGIGWISDDAWPWVATNAHAGGGLDWVYIFPDLGNEVEFWGYNFSRGYYFRGYADIGWYYSYESGNEGWFPYEF